MSTQAVSSQVEHKTVSIYDLIPHESNYNTHPQEQLEDLKASLRRFGQVDDVVVKALPDGKYKIVAHEGVTTAGLQLLEAGECPYFTEQWNITIVPQTWTPLDVKGYMAASNELPRKSSPDESILAALLQEQQNAGFDLAALGSDEETLRQMLEAISQATPDEWTDALGDLPDGDKSPFQQMTFTLTNEQADRVKEALDLALEDKDNFGEMGNQNSNGNALAYIVKFFLDMGKGEADAA